MLSKIEYPKTAKCFLNWCKSNIKWENTYYNLGSPRPFDVTLRDGLQGLTKEEQIHYTFEKKINLYKEIVVKHNPKNIEIGSLTSAKVLPIFSDSIKLLLHLEEEKEKEETEKKLIDIDSELNYHYLSVNAKPENYILVPNQQKLLQTINYKEFNNFSFITSVSESFQKKNIKMSLNDSDKDLLDMTYLLEDHLCHKTPKIKLYVSCINECPIEGKINNDFVIDRIIKLYNSLKPDTICLSDTCGTLNTTDFEYIVDNCNSLGLPFSKMSLHLHVKINRENEVENIIHKALDRKMINFDVSILESGGCSITIQKKDLAPNVSYDLYYKSLVNYILNY